MKEPGYDRFTPMAPMASSFAEQRRGQESFELSGILRVQSEIRILCVRRVCGSPVGDQNCTFPLRILWLRWCGNSWRSMASVRFRSKRHYAAQLTVDHLAIEADHAHPDPARTVGQRSLDDRCRIPAATFVGELLMNRKNFTSGRFAVLTLR